VAATGSVPDAAVSGSTALGPKDPVVASPTRTLGVLAGGFAIDAAADERLLALAQAQRITALAACAGAPAWPQQARRLIKCLPKAVQLGFCFSLAPGSEPLSAELKRVWPQCPPTQRLMLDALTRKLPLDALRTEWRAQWLSFTGYAGRAPGFVTSLGLVHRLAGLRELALQALRSEGPSTWVLHCGRVIGPGPWLQRRLLEDTGGRQLMQQLLALKQPHPPALLGLPKDGAEVADPANYLAACLAALPAEGAVLALEASSEAWCGFLQSPLFDDALRAAGVRLGNPVA
jgi:hypothetical protein